MPDTNKDILQKADLVLGDLQSGGALPEEKADQFIRMVQDQPTLIGSCRVQPMQTSTMEISKMGFGARIMSAPNATGGIDEADRKKPALGKITLTAKKTILGVRVPFDVLDLNVERDKFEQSLMEEIAKRVSLDLEELMVMGDTTLSATDPFLALFDGLVKQGGVRKDFNGVQFGDVSTTGYLMSAMAAKYQADIKAMRFYASFATRQDHLAALSDRGTALGDAVLKGEIDPPTMGIPMIACAALKNDQVKGEDTNLSHGLYLNPLNAVLGMMKDIRFWREESAEEQVLKIVGRAWVAVAVDEADGIGVAEYLGRKDYTA